MSDYILELCKQLDRARSRHDAFHAEVDAPLEPGTPEFDEANLLLKDIEELLDQLSAVDPTHTRGAEAMAAAILAHAGDLRPSVYGMMQRVYRFLCGFDTT